MNLISLPGAGAWLAALPQDDVRDVDPGEFNLALRRRCRLRVQEGDHACPCCGGTMDSFGDHALVCPCKGDRTRRHNRLRDLFCAEALGGRMSPEKEKEGLLIPARPWEDGAPTRADAPNRRPADVWLPRGGGRSAGRPEAIDFAVTCGIRPSRVSLACRAPEDVLQE